MRKTLLILFSIFSCGFYTFAANPIKVTFEDAEIGSKGGVVSVWDAGAIEVIANTYTTGNASAKVLHVPKASYMGLYFDDVKFPAEAETQYSKLRVKYLVVGGTDINYPSLEVFSTPNNYTMGDTEKLATITWANLWGAAEKGVWKTIEFSLSNSSILQIPAGNLILKLVKNDCEYLIDDIELVPAEAATPVITVADFESNSINEELTMQEWEAPHGTATVKANPTKSTEKSVHIITTGFDALLKLNVVLPSGKTIADYDKIKFDIYLLSGEGIENNYKNMQIYVDRTKVYEDEGYPAQGDPNVWITKEYPLKGATPGNSFVLDLGITTPAGNYYLDNIKLIEKISTGFDNIFDAKIYFNSNTLHLSNAGNVQVFDLNGRLIVNRENVSAVDLSTISRGVYIAKAVVEGKTEIIKFVK